MSAVLTAVAASAREVNGDPAAAPAIAPEGAAIFAAASEAWDWNISPLKIDVSKLSSPVLSRTRRTSEAPTTTAMMEVKAEKMKAAILRN